MTIFANKKVRYLRIDCISVTNFSFLEFRKLSGVKISLSTYLIVSNLNSSKIVDLLLDYFIASFTYAVSYHAMTSQLFHVFGLPKIIEFGSFAFFKYWIQIINKIKKTNLVSVTISAVAIQTLLAITYC